MDAKGNENWAFWYSAYPKNFGISNLSKIFEHNLIKICEIDSGDKLKELVSNVWDVSTIKVNSGYYLFRINRIPLWETNLDGGILRVAFETSECDINKIWDRLTQDCVSQKFSSEIIGISIKNKIYAKYINFWINNAQKNHTEIKEEITNYFGIDDIKIDLSYHDESLQIKSLDI